MYRKRGKRGGLTAIRGYLFGFVRKKTAHAREINGEKSPQRALSFSFVGGGGGGSSYKLELEPGNRKQRSLPQ